MPSKSAGKKPPQPAEESDEPVIAGEARYTPKKGAVGLGEWIGQQRQRELEKAEKQQAEIAAGGEYVRQAVAAGIATKQTVDQKIAQKAAAAEATRQRRLTEQAEAEARQAALRSPKKKEQTRLEEEGGAADQKTQDAFRQKFDHAKVELEKEKRNENSLINKLRNQLRTIEGQQTREQSALKQMERQESLGDRQSTQIEREIEQLKEEEKELATSHGKLGPKEQTQLRQVKSKISNLGFKLRQGERKAFSGASLARREETKIKQEKKRVEELKKEISDHETRLAVIEGYLREWQAKHNHRDQARVWREFELDLRNKLGIHIYR